jgi:hypothetical protein
MLGCGRHAQTCKATVPDDGLLHFAIYEGERPLAADNSCLAHLTVSVPQLVRYVCDDPRPIATRACMCHSHLLAVLHRRRPKSL